MKYVVAFGREVVGDAGIIYPSGTECPFDEALLAVGAIAPVNAPTAPASEVDPLNPGGLTEDEEVISEPMDHLSAEQAIALIEMTSDRLQLAKYQKGESTGKNRKSVMAAIEKQFEAQN